LEVPQFDEAEFAPRRIYLLVSAKPKRLLISSSNVQKSISTRFKWKNSCLPPIFHRSEKGSKPTEARSRRIVRTKRKKGGKGNVKKSEKLQHHAHASA